MRSQEQRADWQAWLRDRLQSGRHRYPIRGFKAHGKRSMYNADCRCELCCEANRKYLRWYRRTHLIVTRMPQPKPIPLEERQSMTPVCSELMRKEMEKYYDIISGRKRNDSTLGR